MSGFLQRRILTGEETGPKRDVILMNAGMSLYLGIDGITLAEGIEKAKEEAERLSEEALDRLHTLLGEDTFLEELIRSLVNRRK